MDGLSEIEIYKLILSGRKTRFPKYFWDCKESDIYAPKITKYLIENILNWDSNDVKEKLRKKTFYDYKLAGMISIMYDSSPYKAINAAYPERNYKPWDFVNALNNYWQGEQGKENATKAIKWLFEEELKWNIQDIKKNINHQVFTDNNLLGMLKKAFNSDLFEAINYVYPGIFKKWELGTHVRNDYWTEENGILATKWLIEDKLKWNKEDIKKFYNKQIFIDNDLYGTLQKCFNSSPYEALNKTYPGKFKEWEIPYTPKNFWNKENCYKAIKWLIEEDLKISYKKNIEKYLNKELLINKGLCIPLEKYGVKGLIKLYKQLY